MSKSTIAEIEQRIGSEIDQPVYWVSKKNCDAMTQLNEQNGRIIKSYGVAHSVSQLNNGDDIINATKTISATEVDEVWIGLTSYRGRKHNDEVAAKMSDDERMGQLWQRSTELVSSGTGSIVGDFSSIRV